MSFRRNWVAGCLFVGLVLHTLAASALAVQTPTDGSGPDRQLEVVLGHVETELSGHPRIIHGPVAHTEKWGLAEVTYVLPVREAEPTADKSPVFVEAQLIAHGQQAPNRLVRQRAAWAYRPSPMQYHPKHAWRSLRSPRYRAIRTATYQPKHSWTYCPTDFRYTPAQDKRRTIQDAKVIIQRYRDLGWSVQQIGRNLLINPAEVAVYAAEE